MERRQNATEMNVILSTLCNEILINSQWHKTKELKRAFVNNEERKMTQQCIKVHQVSTTIFFSSVIRNLEFCEGLILYILNHEVPLL